MHISTIRNTRFEGGYDVTKSVTVYVIDGILPLSTLRAIVTEDVIGFHGCEPKDFVMTPDNDGKPKDIMKLSQWYQLNKTVFTIEWLDY